jgi:hypothetical protein
MTYVTIGLTMFFAMLFPIGSYLLQYLGGGMYGSVFRQYPPVVFLSINLLLTYIIPLIFTLISIKKTNLKSRVPQQMPGKVLLLTGAGLILLPQLLRLLTSTVPGGGASFALMSLAAPFVLAAHLLLIIGAVKLFMSVKPSDEYVYSE